MAITTPKTLFHDLSPMEQTKAKASSDSIVSHILQHSALEGYINDGFPIYGAFDIGGETPIVDECNGHFGPIGIDVDTSKTIISYHYHYRDYTYDGYDHFQPYWVGCLGPSLSKCDLTPMDTYDSGANWCGTGCAFDVCVQTGTNKDDFEDYLGGLKGGKEWITQKGHTVNNY